MQIYVHSLLHASLLRLKKREKQNEKWSRKQTGVKKHLKHRFVLGGEVFVETTQETINKFKQSCTRDYG